MRLDAIRRLWERLKASGGKPEVLDTNSFTDSERAVGRMVIPLLEDLELARRTIEDLESRVRAVDVVLRLLPVAAIVIDGDGRLLSSNESARQLFGGPAIPARIVELARIAVRDGTDHQSALAPHPGSSGECIRIVPAQVDPVQEADSPSVAFLVPADGRANPIQTDALTSRFALTPMQARVVSLVARGMSNREVADSLKLSVETVRKHLATAYEKTGVNNRASIVALAYGVRFGGQG